MVYRSRHYGGVLLHVPMLLLLIGIAAHQYALNRQLIIAIERNDPIWIRRLLRQGADPNANVLPGDQRPIWQHIGDGLRHQPLLAQGNYETALETAILWNGFGHGDYADTVKALADAGADVNCPFISPWSMGSGLGGWPHGVVLRTTPLLYAAGCRQWRIVKVLLAYKVDVNATSVDLKAMDNYGEPALMDAVRYAQADVVEALIRRGANIGFRDRSGQTFLMQAIQEAFVWAAIPSTAEKIEKISPQETSEQIRNTVACLIRYGASVNDKDEYGNTALSLARRYRVDQQLIQMLQQAGAKE